MINQIHIDDYPQLALLAWNRAVRVIDDDEAFALYERNWRFVDVEHFNANETALIEELKIKYGNGVLNV